MGDNDDYEAKTSEGAKVRHYEFVSTLGEGSFGKVKLAKNLKTGDHVAIKIVKKTSVSDVEDVERVFRETFILTTLKHKNIIKLFEVIDTADDIMLVMEYAGGGELCQIVQDRERLSEVETCQLFQQIISGVEYCHRAKIIHRDLKLENILLDSDGCVKIADFGLSNSIKITQKIETNCGTPSYTSPEQIDGDEDVGTSADIWSLGVILFTMICGYLPFEADNLPNLFKKIQLRAYKAPDYISKEVKDIIERMLTIDPNSRLSIGEIRSHPWFLMEYTDLVHTIERMPEVKQDHIFQARERNLSFSDAAVKRELQKQREPAQQRTNKVLAPAKSKNGKSTAPSNSTSNGNGHGRGNGGSGSSNGSNGSMFNIKNVSSPRISDEILGFNKRGNSPRSHTTSLFDDQLLSLSSSSSRPAPSPMLKNHKPNKLATGALGGDNAGAGPGYLSNTASTASKSRTRPVR